MTMTPERIAELDAVMANATAGEWQADGLDIKLANAKKASWGKDEANNVAAIVALHNAYPDLKAHIAVLEAEVVRLTSLMLDEDGISDAIEESFDVEWSSRDGARHVVGWFEVELGRAALAKASA